MQFGTVPECWKLATVVPIFKKGASSKVSNYRPISLTCACCKIFESVVKTHLLTFIHDNQLITKSQHGFLKGRSTCTNLLETLNDCSQYMNDANDTLIVYIDFAKAFDSVSVPKLIFKLKHFGITGSLLSCINSLLRDRSQRVRVGSALSTVRSIKSGVAQGSVLGPILFVLFLNDMESCLPKCATSKFFADDMKSYMPIVSPSSIDDFSSLLSAIERWALTWQLPLSTDKCCWMLLSNRLSSQNLNFHLSGVHLLEKNEVQDLGVLFKANLNFSDHISAIIYCTCII